MRPEISEAASARVRRVPRKHDPKNAFWTCNDINLAAALFCDDKVPRLEAHSVSELVDDTHSFYRFRVKFSDRGREIRDLWRRLANKEDVQTSDPVKAVYWALQYHNRIVRIIQSDQRILPRPTGERPGLTWTTNSQMPAAALAVAGLYDIGDERFRAMAHYDGGKVGFFITSAEVLSAFENPQAYLVANPEAALSYVMAAFHIRDRLFEIVKSLPGRRHIFKDEEGVHFVAEPDPERQ